MTGRPIGPDIRIRAINGDHKLRRLAPEAHGRRSSYVMGCRCDPCRDAEATYSRERYRTRRRVNNTPIIPSLSHAISPQQPGLSTRNTQAVDGLITSVGFAHPLTEMEP